MAIETRLKKRIKYASFKFSQIKLDNKKIKSTIHIESLPTEILFKILLTMSNQELLNPSQVCKKWNAITSDTYFWYLKFLNLGSIINGQFKNIEKNKHSYYD